MLNKIRFAWFASAMWVAGSATHAALVGNPGDMYVSGQHASTIYEVNPTTGAIVGSASANGGTATGIRFGPSGNLYCVDFGDGTLEEYNGTTGAHVSTVASGIEDGYGLAIINNQFYVADSEAERIDVFNNSGVQVNAIHNSDFGNLPLSMIVSPSNRLLVGTRNGTSIDSMNLDGSSPSTFASGSQIDSGFGLAYGPNGNLYESNASTNSIIELNPTTGAYITSITGGGLDSPLGIAFGPNGNLYVANGGDNTLSVFNGTTGAPITTFSGFSGVYDITFASVPEPASIGIFAVGIVGLLSRRRRTRFDQR